MRRLVIIRDVPNALSGERVDVCHAGETNRPSARHFRLRGIDRAMDYRLLIYTDLGAPFLQRHDGNTTAPGLNQGFGVEKRFATR